MDNLFESISKFGWLLIGAGITLIIYIIVERFKNRVARFIYWKSYNHIATTIDDGQFGNIKVIYNDNYEARHVGIINLTIKNDSNTDFEDVVITCWVDVNSKILTHKAYHQEYGTILNLESAFQDIMDGHWQVIEHYEQNPIENQDPPLDLINSQNFILHNLVLNVPTWNRKDSVNITLLVENDQGKQPLLMHPISKKSIKLVEASKTKDEDKQTGLWVICLNHLIFVTSLIAYLNFELSQIAFFILIGTSFWLSYLLYWLGLSVIQQFK